MNTHTLKYNALVIVGGVALIGVGFLAGSATHSSLENGTPKTHFSIGQTQNTVGGWFAVETPLNLGSPAENAAGAFAGAGTVDPQPFITIHETGAVSRTSADGTVIEYPTYASYIEAN